MMVLMIHKRKPPEKYFNKSPINLIFQVFIIIPILAFFVLLQLLVQSHHIYRFTYLTTQNKSFLLKFGLLNRIISSDIFYFLHYFVLS